jgi:hypothetical protein
MFQCHFTEHMELGLMGWFQVRNEKGNRAGQSGRRQDSSDRAGN